MEAPKWDACTMDPHRWMRFIECHPGFASYIQAFFSVIAILVAVAVPALMMHFANVRQAKERVIHANNIVIAAAPHVFSTWGRAKLIKNIITQMRGAMPTFGNQPKALAILKLEVSPVIERLLIPKTDADPATLQTLNLLAIHAAAYNNLVGDYAKVVIPGSTQWDEALKSLGENIDAILHVAGQLIEQYESAVDGNASYLDAGPT